MQKKISIICILAGTVSALLYLYMAQVLPIDAGKILYEPPGSNTSIVAINVPVQQSTDNKLNLLKEHLAQCIAKEGFVCSVYINTLESSSSPIVINNEKVRAASVIKIFIMAEAFRQAKAGLISLDEEHVITSKEKVGGSGVLQSTPNGTRKTLGELIDLMISESDNTATNIIIERISMDNVNKLISRMGFQDTLLQRKMMDWESVKIGKENYTSAVDVGEVLKKIYYGQCIGPEQDAAMLKILLRQTDNDKIPALLPRQVKVAHKTGELTGAIHDDGIVYGEKQDYVVCIMTEGVRNPADTVRVIANLSQIIYQSLN